MTFSGWINFRYLFEFENLKTDNKNVSNCAHNLCIIDKNEAHNLQSSLIMRKKLHIMRSDA